MSTASGLVSPKAVIEATICSTGSIGVRCVMKKVSEMPMKTTRRNCTNRLNDIEAVASHWSNPICWSRLTAAGFSLTIM